MAEGELDASPMAGMLPPQIPDEPSAALTDDELRRLLKACEGRDFTDRRDAAILRLFLDTGIRVSEAPGIMLPGDLDLDDQVVIVLERPPASGSSPLVARPPLPWTDTCDQWSRHEARRSVFHGCILISSATPCRLLAVGRRQRGRPDASGRLAIAPDGRPLCEVHCGAACS